MPTLFLGVFLCGSLLLVERANMGKARIFVADDDKDLSELIRTLLEDDGYSVTMLKAVSNAYEEIAASLPDLLILDITLEHPDVGWLVLDKVKLDPATFDIPVIICSAAISAIRDNQDRLKRLGCFVVEKPFDIDELLTVTARALDEGPHATAEETGPLS
ncbi:MAG TPA: response regulator [Chloroflexia bacterium]|nr:response regulator [Chloroflexia bacterium]